MQTNGFSYLNDAPVSTNLTFVLHTERNLAKTIAQLGSLYPFKGAFNGYQFFAHVVESIENLVNAVVVLVHGDNITRAVVVQSARKRTFRCVFRYLGSRDTGGQTGIRRAGPTFTSREVGLPHPFDFAQGTPFAVFKGGTSSPRHKYSGFGLGLSRFRMSGVLYFSCVA